MNELLPFFSIILTTMDRPALLRSAIDSVLAQSWQGFEVIIVDDGMMPDYLPEVMRDPRFIYLNKKNHRRGVAASRNLGLELARGSYVCFLDDDDRLDPQFLSWVQDAAERFPGRAFFGNFDMVEEQLSGSTRTELVRTFNGIANWDVSRALVSNFIPICAAAFPAAARLPRFDETLPSHEDWDFLLACLATLEFVGVDRHACEVRQRAAQPGEHRHNSRRPYFAFDFLAIYQRHPLPELAQARATMLQSLGLQVPAIILENIGRS
jgi:glycosyltransferase involved in cell wall biosynthesis